MLFHLESLEKKQIVNMRETKLDHRNFHDFDEWVSTWENPSSGFSTMQDSNQPAQLQRLARMLNFCL